MPYIPDIDPLNFGNEPGEGPLRVGGKATSDLPGDPNNLPSQPNKAAKAQAAAVERVRDLWGGTAKLHEKSTQYLPKAPGEEYDAYQQRLTRSVFFNAFRRAVEGLTGLIFRKDPALGEDVPPLIEEHWENIDLAGTHGAVFAREVEQDAMIAGHAAILVDFPDTGGQQSRADELSGGLRPYWVPIRKEDIISWRTANVAGQTVLTQLVIRECQYVPDGEFGEKEQTLYRVFRRTTDETGEPPVSWMLLEVTEKRTVVMHASGYCMNQTEIPVAEVATSGRRGLFESSPPLIDLADLNIAHYQQWSDAAYSRFVSCVPVLFGAGMDGNDENGQPIKVGPNHAIFTPEPNAKLAWVAHDGSSLEDCRRALEDLKSDMGTIGVAMLAPQKREAETAEAKRLDKATSDSALSTSARALQDALERALIFHANYLNLEQGGSIEVNRDFEGVLMEPQVMTAFANLVSQGLPWDIALDQLQRGGRIGEDVNPEEVALVIAGEMAAQREFEAEQARQRFQQFEDQNADG